MTIKTPIKQDKRTMHEVKETLKDIMHISKDRYLADDLGINYNSLRNAVCRNVITAPMYEAILRYCMAKRIDANSVFYKTKATNAT